MTTTSETVCGGQLPDRFFAFLCAVLFFFLCSCTQSAPRMRDGYYTAESVTYDAEGWKDFLTIYVMNDRITTVEFNARNVAGLLKSWDLDYMARFKKRDGVYPTRAARAYVSDLLNKQSSAAIQPTFGVLSCYTAFKTLAEAAVAQAKAGNGNIVFVRLPENGRNGAIRADQQ